MAPASRRFKFGLNTAYCLYHESCGHGITLSGTCHDPAVHAWIVCLDALLGPDNVRSASVPAAAAPSISLWQELAQASSHRPDIVLCGFDGPNT